MTSRFCERALMNYLRYSFNYTCLHIVLLDICYVTGPIVWVQTAASKRLSGWRFLSPKEAQFRANLDKQPKQFGQQASWNENSRGWLKCGEKVVNLSYFPAARRAFVAVNGKGHLLRENLCFEIFYYKFPCFERNVSVNCLATVNQIVMRFKFSCWNIFFLPR